MPETVIKEVPKAEESASLESGKIAKDPDRKCSASAQKIQKLLSGDQDICSFSKKDFLFLLRAVKAGELSMDDLKDILKKLSQEGKFNTDDLRNLLTKRGKSCEGKTLDELLDLLDQKDISMFAQRILSVVGESLGFLKSTSTSNEKSSAGSVPLPFFIANVLSGSGYVVPTSQTRSRSFDSSAGTGGSANTSSKTDYQKSEDPLSILVKAASEGLKKAADDADKNKGGTLLFKSEKEQIILEQLRSKYGSDLVAKINPQHQFGDLSITALVAELEKLKRDREAGAL